MPGRVQEYRSLKILCALPQQVYQADKESHSMNVFHRL